MDAPHILVVGGSRGLGKEFAALARERGHRVSAIARSWDTDPESGRYSFDLTQLDKIGDTIDRIARDRGFFDGVAFFQRFRMPGVFPSFARENEVSVEATAELMHQCLDVHRPGFLRWTSPRSFVLTSSMACQSIWPDVPLTYHVAKAGMIQLARYYAARVGRRGVRVNAVCPGSFVKAENQDWYCRHAPERQSIESASALGRMGTAREVAEVILFLLSDRASLITGQAIAVDGGASIQAAETRGELQ